jgi:ELWxxDGT repeat protein
MNTPYLLSENTLTAQNIQYDTQGIVFIDAAVEDSASLLAGVMPGLEVFLLDSALDGVAQISALLAGCSNLKSLHIVSHGQPGAVQLGNGWLSAATISQNADALMGWAKALAADAELLIYGCEVANEQKGQSFVAQMRELTGAAVVASTTTVGNGRWVLDVYGAETTSIQLAFTSVVFSQYTATLSSIRYPMTVSSSQSANVNGTLYFEGTYYFGDPFYLDGLWKIDSSGSPVRVIDPSTGSSPFTSPANLTNVDGTLYFRAYSDSNGYEIWKIDPLTGKPILLEVVAGRGSYYPDNLTSVNGTLYFTAPSYGFTILCTFIA